MIALGEKKEKKKAIKLTRQEGQKAAEDTEEINSNQERSTKQAPPVSSVAAVATQQGKKLSLSPTPSTSPEKGLR